MSGFLGIVMLDTRFPRLRGDVGAADTFAMPVRHRVVAGASPQRIVVDADPALLESFFVAAVRALADEGAVAITTSCGFLARHQAQLQAEVEIPVWTSSLLLLPELDAALPAGRRAGVVTVDAVSFDAALLAAVEASATTPVEGLADDSEFRRTLLGNRMHLDPVEAEAATVAAACRLVERHPEVGTIVLECTNMPPYAAAVRAATGRPVHDITTLVGARYGHRVAHRVAAA